MSKKEQAGLRTRLFVSHSSHSQGDQQRLRRLVELLDDCGKGYKLLVDYRDIRGGDQWREKIHAWLAECQGAVILFNTSALGSKWVLKEATILSWRKALEGDDFKLLPARITASISTADFEAGDYSPLLLNEIQHITSGRPEDIEAAVRQAIPVKIGSTSPLAKLISEIADQIDDVGDRAIEHAGVQHFPQEWSTGGKSRKKRFADLLARKIFQMGPESLSGAVVILNSLSSTLDPEIAQRILRIIEPLWVEPDAAALFPNASGRICNYRDLAMCSRRLGDFYDFTAECYVERGYLGSNLWWIIRVDDSSDDDPVGHISSRIRSKLKEQRPRLAKYEPEEIDTYLNEDVSDPVFVLLPSIPDEAVLDVLRKQYKNISFLMHTQQRCPNRDPLPVGATYVDPELSEDDERKAINGRDRADHFINQLRRIRG